MADTHNVSAKTGPIHTCEVCGDQYYHLEPSQREDSEEVRLYKVLQTFDLQDETDELARQGIKKECDLAYLDEELIKDLPLTPVSKAKLRRAARWIAPVQAEAKRAKEKTEEENKKKDGKAAAAEASEKAAKDLKLEVEQLARFFLCGVLRL